jgi:hypothetical protein
VRTVAGGERTHTPTDGHVIREIENFPAGSTSRRVQPQSEQSETGPSRTHATYASLEAASIVDIHPTN